MLATLPTTMALKRRSRSALASAARTPTSSKLEDISTAFARVDEEAALAHGPQHALGDQAQVVRIRLRQLRAEACVQLAQLAREPLSTLGPAAQAAVTPDCGQLCGALGFSTLAAHLLRLHAPSITYALCFA